MMRKSLALMSVIGMVAFTGAVHAQSVMIVDTIGTGTAFNVGSGQTNGKFIGSDPGAGTRPETNTTAGYAVLPFTVNSLALGGQVDSVTLAMNLQAPLGTRTDSFLSLLSAAIIEAPASLSLSATGLTSNDFFGFDLSPNEGLLGNPNLGDNTVHLYNSIGAKSRTNITQGKTYWLVVAPKRGLNAQDSENVLSIGVWQHRGAVQINGSPATEGRLDNGITTVGQGLSEAYFNAGANPGDILVPTATQANLPLYFGAKISIAPVPAPSSLVALLIGAVPGGLLFARRKRSSSGK